MAVRLIFTEPKVSGAPLMMVGSDLAPAPRNIWARFSSRKEMPMAVMSSEIRGARRSGV
jgi:hypothetical protein